MAAITEETGARLLAMLEAQQSKQQSPAPAQHAMPAQAPAFGMGGFGMPGRGPKIPAATMQPATEFGKPQLQPSGINNPITHHLPDGAPFHGRHPRHSKAPHAERRRLRGHGMLSRRG